jgi:hypothetical protein
MRIDFQELRARSDGGLLLARELDERLDLKGLNQDHGAASEAEMKANRRGRYPADKCSGETRRRRKTQETNHRNRQDDPPFGGQWDLSFTRDDGRPIGFAQR